MTNGGLPKADVNVYHNNDVITYNKSYMFIYHIIKCSLLLFEKCRFGRLTALPLLV